MYLAERSGRRDGTGSRAAGAVAPTVVMLGLVSLATDVSSEAVNAVLPLYLTAALGMSPLAYGFIDGIYQGVSALVRIAAASVADRGDRPKWVAFAGYAMSAVARIALLISQGFAAVTSVIAVDRLGKGIRTAPRDAMIAASSTAGAKARSFGVHRALDTFGAMLGPLLAFGLLAWLPNDYQAVFVASFAFALVGLAILGLGVGDVRPRRDTLAATLPRPAGHEDCLLTCRDCVWAKALARARQSEQHPRLDGSLLRIPQVWRILSVASLLALLTVGDGFLYLMLQRRSDIAAAYFPLLYVGTNAAYLALAVPLGRLADRWGRARVYLVGHLPLVLAFLATLLPALTNGWVLVPLMLLGAYYAATDGVVAALTSEHVPVARAASGLAAVQTGIALARFASSIAFGALWGVFGPERALVGVVVVLVAVLPLAWRVLRPLDRPIPVTSVPA